MSRVEAFIRNEGYFLFGCRDRSDFSSSFVKQAEQPWKGENLSITQHVFVEVG